MRESSPPDAILLIGFVRCDEEFKIIRSVGCKRLCRKARFKPHRRHIKLFKLSHDGLRKLICLRFAYIRKLLCGGGEQLFLFVKLLFRFRGKLIG